MPIDPATFESLVNIYEEEIDSLIAAMGKDCILYYHKIVTNHDSEIHDPIHEDSRKPFYKTEESTVPAEDRETTTIKALIKHNPTDYETFGLRVKEARDIVRLKTLLTDIPNIKRCDYMVPDANVVGIIDAKYKLVREPVPQGLKRNRYALSYWERV